jgi:hypothetical protein
VSVARAEEMVGRVDDELFFDEEEAAANSRDAWDDSQDNSDEWTDSEDSDVWDE